VVESKSLSVLGITGADSGTINVDYIPLSERAYKLTIYA
jgi:hypothetical protein